MDQKTAVSVHENRIPPFVYAESSPYKCALPEMSGGNEFRFIINPVEHHIACKALLRQQYGKIRVIDDPLSRRAKIDSFSGTDVFTMCKNNVFSEHIKSMAQYLDDDVLRKHIFAFVNEYSFDISPIKSKLLQHLEKCAI